MVRNVWRWQGTCCDIVDLPCGVHEIHPIGPHNRAALENPAVQQPPMIARDTRYPHPHIPIGIVRLLLAFNCVVVAGY